MGETRGEPVRVIDMGTWPRREHFAKFAGFRYPHFSMCAPVDLTALQSAVKEHRVSLAVAIWYAVARAANDIAEFRCRIRGDQVVEHGAVHPSLTALVEGDLFAFAQVEYSAHFGLFSTRAAVSLARAREQPALDDEPGRDDLLFMSAIPWVSFTAFSHPMPSFPADSIPRFAWGNAYPEGGRVRLPLSVQAHHALLDGIHMAHYYERVQGLLADPATWLGERQGRWRPTRRAGPAARRAGFL